MRRNHRSVSNKSLRLKRYSVSSSMRRVKLTVYQTIEHGTGNVATEATAMSPGPLGSQSLPSIPDIIAENEPKL